MAAPLESRSRGLLPLLGLAGAVVLWGTSFASTKIALTAFDPMVVVWMRMAMGSVIVAFIWPFIPKPEYRRGDWRWLAALSLFQPCLYFLFEGYALNYTTAMQAGALSAIVPLLVAVGARVFLAERLSRTTLIAVALSMVGVALLSLGSEAGPHATNPVLGNVLQLLAFVCAAGYMLLVKHLSSRYNPLLLACIQILAGTIFFAPAALTADWASILHAPPGPWAAAVYLGVLVTLGANALYNFGISRLPAARAALAINMIPLVSVLSGWLALGESLTPVQAVAGVVIGYAMLLGVRSSRREPRESPPVPEAA